MSRFKLLAAAVTVALVAMPVNAVPPVIDTWVDAGVYDLGDICGEGFDVRMEEETRYREQAFFNRTGDILRVNQHVAWRFTFTNMTTGTVLDETEHCNFIYDFVNETITHSGQLYRIKVRAQGLTYQDIGRVVHRWAPGVEILFISGPNHDMELQLLDYFEDGLCPGLSE